MLSLGVRSLCAHFGLFISQQVIQFLLFELGHLFHSYSNVIKSSEFRSSFVRLISTGKGIPTAMEVSLRFFKQIINKYSDQGLDTSTSARDSLRQLTLFTLNNLWEEWWPYG